jgi:RHS repeat-associated protein
VTQTVPGASTQDRKYLVDPVNPTGYAQVVAELREISGSDVLQRGYLIGHRVLAQISGGGTAHHLLADGRGSTRGLATESATIAEAYDYDAYGNTLDTGTMAGAAGTPLLYNGEWHDANANMQYLRARWYDSGVGRFNRLDPFAGVLDNPLTLHKYAYAHGDPVNGIDPSGMITLAEVLNSTAIVASLGGLSGGIIVALAGGAVGDIARGAIFGAVAGAIISLALASGRGPDVLGAGFLGGLANFIIDAIGDQLRMVSGKLPLGGAPSSAKYLNSFLRGFAVASAEAFFNPSGSFGRVAIASAIVFSASFIDAIGNGNWGIWRATTDAMIAAAIGLILNPSVIATLRPGGRELAESVAASVSRMGAFALTTEIGLLLHVYTP